MGWQAIAHDPKLKGYVQTLEESLLFANPAAGNFSQTGYDAEVPAVKMIGQFGTGDSVNGIANEW
jgi:hypothetical protein